ncbi:MAG: ATP-binding cassette domain-containing protein [Verrucomicrobiota bacterium]
MKEAGREPLIRVDHLNTFFTLKSGFPAQKKIIRAVDDLSFDIPEGSTVGLVGESGSGKTTLARTLIKLCKSTSGSVYYRGRDILPLSERAFRPLRKELQIIFQDPYASLNPYLTIREILREPYRIHFPRRETSEVRNGIGKLLDYVGLPQDAADRFPHEFSGGQRQRIGIARALAVEPSFVICDEPVSALDVSVQAQIINLLQDLQKEFNLTYLFIAHDLAVVEHISDHVLVMYHGKLVESAPADDIYRDPQHDYTRRLLEAVPKLPPLKSAS